MSSSRSIAAARNRRSGDSHPQQQQQQQQINRPGTSIASQSALQGGNRRIQPPQQQPLSQPKMTQQPQTQPQRVKLSVSDAIGLITLRLGRIEQILIDQEGAALSHAGELSIPDGTQLVDKSVFSSIINRLEVAETKGKAITSYEEIIQRLERELKELKDALFKHEASVKKSFEDVDAAFVDLENQVQLEQPLHILLPTENDVTMIGIVNDTPEVIVDLKSLVQQDLIGI